MTLNDEVGIGQYTVGTEISFAPSQFGRKSRVRVRNVLE